MLNVHQTQGTNYLINSTYFIVKNDVRESLLNFNLFLPPDIKYYYAFVLPGSYQINNMIKMFTAG